MKFISQLAARRWSMVALCAGVALVCVLFVTTAITRPAPLAAPAVGQHRYEIRGIVKSVDRPRRQATIRHEKVGDYMEAMTMPFLIKDDKALSRMQPGTRIRGILVATDEGAQWIEQIVIEESPAA